MFPLCLFTSLLITAPDHQITVVYPCVQAGEIEADRQTTLNESRRLMSLKLLDRKRIVEQLSDTFDFLRGPLPCKMPGRVRHADGKCYLEISKP